jgi:hypothetical protein
VAFNFQNDILVTTLSRMLLSANSTKVTSNGPKMLQDSRAGIVLVFLAHLPASNSRRLGSSRSLTPFAERA